MFALPYLLFLGCLGFFLSCVDLIRWLISRFQFPNRHSKGLSKGWGVHP